MNTTAILLLVVSLGFGARAVYSRVDGDSPTSVRLDEIIGHRVDSLIVADSGSSWRTIRPRGRPTVVYSFLTTCPACNHQKDHVRQLFATLPPDQLLSLTPEPHDLTAAYWGTALPAPLQVHPQTIRDLELRGVPSLLILDSRGIITEARLGVLLDWQIADLHRRMREAQ